MYADWVQLFKGSAVIQGWYTYSRAVQLFKGGTPIQGLSRCMLTGCSY